MRQINTRIEEEIYRRWKATGHKLSHIVTLGIMAAEKNPGYIDRIATLEQNNTAIMRKLESAMRRLNSLEEEPASVKI